MTIINITEMNKEQLVAVFNANSKLQKKVLDDAIESEMLHIDDMLDYLRGSLNDWSIGTCQHNYIKVGDSNEFIDNLLALQEDYGIFSDNDKHIITEMVELRDKYFNMEGPCEDDFEDEEGEFDEEAYDTAVEAYDEEVAEVEYQYEEAVKDLASAVARQFTRMLDYYYSNEAQLDYFLDFYAQERLDDNYYIDTTNTANPYELFQDVAYTKSFK